MASDYGDEAGGKLLDWMLRIGQEAGAEAMARSARELSERLAGIRGTIAGGRAARVAAEGAPTYFKLSLEELSGLPEYATIKEIVSDRLRAASVEHHILPGEVNGRGHHVEVLRRRVGDLLHGRAAVEQLDRGAPLGGGPVVEAEEVGGRRLRVEVDEQGPKAPGGEAKSNVVVEVSRRQFFALFARAAHGAKNPKKCRGPCGTPAGVQPCASKERRAGFGSEGRRRTAWNPTWAPRPSGHGCAPSTAAEALTRSDGDDVTAGTTGCCQVAVPRF